MAEEEKDETTEEPQGDEPQDDPAAGPAAEDAPPAESPEEAPATPPADEAPEAPADESPEEPVAEEAPAEEPVAEEAPAEEPVADEADSEEEPPAEEAEAEDAATEGPEETATEAPDGETAKKPDLPPGAELDPIALEPEANLSAEERARLEAEEEERARREAELVGESEEPAAAARAPAKLESGARYLATGKRKRSIARVTLSPGDGTIEINKRTLEEYFPRPLHQSMAKQPLAATGYEGNVDVRVRVHGGGVGGQAGAVRHGIARALTEIDPELRGDLKRRGLLTRDARVKERRKAGLKKARKRPQFSKR
jgi:small subunit ribosomal protein S9